MKHNNEIICHHITAAQAARRPVQALIALAMVAFLLFAMAPAANAQITDVPAVCQTDAIAYWKLNETSGTTFEDSIGSHDGSCTTALNCPTPVFGQVNDAQSFDGSNIRVDVPSSVDFNWAANGSFSIALWVNIPDTASCTGNKVFVGRYGSSGNPSWWVGCDGTTNRASFSLRDSLGAAGSITASDTPLNNGQWHYVVAVRDGSSNQSRIYVNGTQKAVGSRAFVNDFTSDSGVTLGYHNAPPFYYLPGTLDEVAIYGRALTPAEITRQYQAGLLNFGYDVDNWTVADGDWTANASWYGGAAPAAGDYAVVRDNTNLTGATTAACVDVLPGATLDFGGNELTVDGAFNNFGTVRQTKAADTASTMVEFLHVQNSATNATKYRGAEVTPTSTALGDVTVAIRAADVAGGNYCTTSNSSLPPYADRCFTLTAGTNGPATIRLYAANPGELNGITVANLRPYRFAAGWDALMPASIGTEGSFAYAEATTPGFSSFLLGGEDAPTAVSLHTFNAKPDLSIGLLLLSGLLLLTPVAYLLQRRRRA